MNKVSYFIHQPITEWHTSTSEFERCMRQDLTSVLRSKISVNSLKTTNLWKMVTRQILIKKTTYLLTKIEQE